MSDRPDCDRIPTGIRLDNDRTAVTIAEAARVLGLSTDAVRKRLQRGTIPGEKIGETWRVFLEVDAPPAGRPDLSSPRPDNDRTRPESGRTVAADPDPLVETLREEVAYLREQLAERSRELAAERERFDVLHREALARIPALGAGQDAPQASPEPRHTAEGVEPAGDASVPWWKFWERWM
ncbi:MAG: helix-turn-helix domain-containing protein [Chloroflexota bacterium]|nr:helix-turn-helix domain-containing protein [Chloroflexota bacterium]